MDNIIFILLIQTLNFHYYFQLQYLYYYPNFHLLFIKNSLNFIILRLWVSLFYFLIIKIVKHHYYCYYYFINKKSFIFNLKVEFRALINYYFKHYYYYYSILSLKLNYCINRKKFSKYFLKRLNFVLINYCYFTTKKTVIIKGQLTLYFQQGCYCFIALFITVLIVINFINLNCFCLIINLWYFSYFCQFLYSIY